MRTPILDPPSAGLDEVIARRRRSGLVAFDGRARRGDRFTGRRDLGEAAFYAAHGVDELMIVEPDVHSVHWLGLDQEQGEYRPIDSSSLIDLGPDRLAGLIDWP